MLLCNDFVVVVVVLVYSLMLFTAWNFGRQLSIKIDFRLQYLHFEVFARLCTYTWVFMWLCVCEWKASVGHLFSYSIDELSLYFKARAMCVFYCFLLWISVVWYKCWSLGFRDIVEFSQERNITNIQWQERRTLVINKISDKAKYRLVWRHISGSKTSVRDGGFVVPPLQKKFPQV